MAAPDSIEKENRLLGHLLWSSIFMHPFDNLDTYHIGPSNLDLVPRTYGSEKLVIVNMAPPYHHASSTFMTASTLVTKLCTP